MCIVFNLFKLEKKVYIVYNVFAEDWLVPA